MPIKINIFHKMVLLIASLLVPILALYGYSNQVSVDVVKAGIESSTWNRLSFFMSQMESNLDQLSKFAIIASRSPGIRDYMESWKTDAPYDRIRKRSKIEEQLILQSATSTWVNQLTVYSPESKEIVSTDYSITDRDIRQLMKRESQTWDYVPAESGGEEAYFSRYTYVDRQQTDLLVEVRFLADNIQNMLAEFRRTDQANPFFYHPQSEPIVSGDTDSAIISELVSLLNRKSLEPSGSEIVKIHQKKYSVNYVQSKSLPGWYLVDYEPLEEILSPITKSRNLFYGSAALLLALSLSAALLLYWQVQMPIKQLIRGVKGLKTGNYSIRLQNKVHNEFEYLILRFNEMAEQIQQLIETIYEEKIRLREATLKQLQSQINPHFLYNCLFYIKNMASLGETEAVAAMALNLGQYYRYATRVESEMATIEEEIKLVTNYLVIQNLRIERFHFEIDIPESMRKLRIPRLTIQPLVENAVIHGVERSARYGIIRITGRSSGGEHRIVVEDNGGGMSDEAMAKLQQQLALPMDDEMGCGIWNVHQRLLHRYKGGSGLQLARSESGGLSVTMKWESDECG